MSKRDVFYREVYQHSDLWLPEEEGERQQTARRVFGARMVGCIDVGIETAERILAEHDEFAEFTDEQKAKILSLVSHTSYGTLFSQCARWDHFPQADLQIRVVERDFEGTPLRSTLIAAGSEEELHHHYFDWVDDFGEYYEDNSSTRFALRKPDSSPS
jgi:hypothetical protein